MQPSSSATTPKTKRGRTRKEVSGSNLEGDLRPKRSTIYSESFALERAKEVQASLSYEFPSCIKYMHQSHVSSSFWLSLPKRFCEMNLPKHNATIVLEDENGREYKTKYLAKKVALCGGWKGFSKAHKLRVGDVLVFHLILPPEKFKVYIIRSRESNEADVAHDRPHLDACATQHDSVAPQGNVSSNSTMILDAGDQNFGSEIPNGIRSEPTLNFQQVMGFSIVVNGTVLDSKLSKRLKTKYYELCCSERMFLHENLEGQDCELVVGMISQMVNIADAIRASKITTSLDSFALWYKSLKGYEMLGMKVSFLLARLEKLMSLVSRSKRYAETRIKRDKAEEEKKMLELRLVEGKNSISRLNVELDSLNLERLDLEAHFLDLANTP